MKRKRHMLQKEAAEKNIVADLDADVAFPDDGWVSSLQPPYYCLLNHSAKHSVLVSARQSLGLRQPVATSKYLTLLKALTRDSNFSRMAMSRKSKPPLARTTPKYAAMSFTL